MRKALRGLRGKIRQQELPGVGQFRPLPLQQPDAIFQLVRLAQPVKNVPPAIDSEDSGIAQACQPKTRRNADNCQETEGE
ncbi:MAG: hypothetical protein AMXMBFR82_17720 [Candidatus Hydrogenedentota bacterium]